MLKLPTHKPSSQEGVSLMATYKNKHTEQTVDAKAGDAFYEESDRWERTDAPAKKATAPTADLAKGGPVAKPTALIGSENGPENVKPVPRKRAAKKAAPKKS